MTIKSADFDYLSKLVRERSAIVLETGKEYLVEARLTPLARREGFTSLEALITQLRTTPYNQVHRKVVDAMTTNETTFFRDIHPFDMLKKIVLPAIIEKRQAMRDLTIWSAACSSGQEPYSIAMLLRENFPALASWNVRILATDISQGMLERTRQGRFNQLEINRGLPAVLLVKYFERQGLEWQIKPELRAMLEVRELNLAEPWNPLPAVDIIFIRNVMIYFDVEMKKHILRKLRQVLRPGGYLFLGGAETTLNLDSTFTRLNHDKAICYQV
ncbi:MAG: protein-glutamate O-methyltransferase CheR [Acidobacteria bacterium]|nr:protein-glutamate O-methyltransferase CheR [Acidobacteriota bacterium]MBI3426972.1 protein-glutamate O-methyltransferase CheR [Acidobacteriota bacterium]